MELGLEFLLWSGQGLCTLAQFPSLEYSGFAVLTPGRSVLCSRREIFPMDSISSDESRDPLPQKEIIDLLFHERELDVRNFRDTR